MAALFVDEGMGYMDSGYLMADKAAVADYIEEGAGRHWSMQLSECAAQGVLWHCKSVEHEDCMRAGVGLDELRTDMTLTQKDGKIQYIEFKPSAEDGAAIDAGDGEVLDLGSGGAKCRVEGSRYAYGPNAGASAANCWRSCAGSTWRRTGSAVVAGRRTASVLSQQRKSALRDTAELARASPRSAHAPPLHLGEQ